MALAQFPRIVGINQLADETAMVDDDVMFVREANNVDIDSFGNVSRRVGQEQLLSGSGYHSITATKRGWLMLCNKHQLGVFDPSTGAFDPLVDMDESYRTSFTEENGNLYAMNPGFSCMFKPNDIVARPIGVPLPDATPSFDASTSQGSLRAGSYAVTYSLVDPDGEESGLGPVVKITLDDTGSIVATFLTPLTGYTYRFYMTTTDGEELYQVEEFDADRTTHTIMEHEGGRQPQTQGLETPPNGHIIRAFGSRLLIGTTDYVYFTEPFRPHLHDGAHGWISTSGFTTMVEPVGDGVFIADKRGVRFYNGEDPMQWRVSEASPEKVVFGTSTVIPGSAFEGDIEQHDEVAVWLTSRGYEVGLPTGEVVSLNANQVKLPSYIQGCTAFVTRNGRKQLVSPVNSNLLASASVALDSAIN